MISTSVTTCARYAVTQESVAAEPDSVPRLTYSLKALTTWKFPSGSFVINLQPVICDSYDIPSFSIQSRPGRFHSVLYSLCPQVATGDEIVEGEGQVKVLLVEPDLITSACSASGRFVYQNWDNEHRRFTFYPVDYLA